MKKRSSMFVGLGIALIAGMNAAAQIAAESFWTTSDGSEGVHYRDSTQMNNAVNSGVTSGTSGFDVSNPWNFGNDRLLPFAAVSLSHNGVVGACFPGSMGLIAWSLEPESWRPTARQLTAAPLEAVSYYLSGLIRVDALDLKTNELCAAGFGTAANWTSSISDGFHYGVRNRDGRHYLAAFAGSSAYDLVELTAAENGLTWQVILQMDVNVNVDGGERLFGWYWTNNAPAVSCGFSANVETWANTNTLRTFRLSTKTKGRGNNLSDKSSRVYFDEVRLGTNLTQVADLSAPPLIVVYRQPFDKNGSYAPITDYGWTAHYGSEATPFFPVPSGYNYYAQPYVNGNDAAKGYILDNVPGSGARGTSVSGTAPKLVWTEVSGDASVAVARLEMLTFELARQGGVRVAIQVDGSTAWYLSQMTFVPSGAQLLDFEYATWDALTFEPGIAMIVGSEAAFPQKGKITALGFYYQISGNDDLQLDRIFVWAGPPLPPQGTVILVM